MRCSPTGEVICSPIAGCPRRSCAASRAKDSSTACGFSTAAGFRSRRWRSGIAQGAYEAALKYSKQRKQFGRFISEFQAIQHKLADMATEIDAARLLTLRAAWLKDNGQSVNKESAMAKLFASEVAVRVANEAVQVHGGYGFIKDYPVEKFYRDVKLCTIGEGTSEIQRLVIARQLAEKCLLTACRRRRFCGGDMRALARAATWIENRRPEAEPLLRELFPHTGRALILGVTGAPGAGKSTLCDQLRSRANCAREGKTVGVIAVDPTSPYTGGAILGDRIRMQQHHADPACSSAPWRRADGWAGWRAATTEMTMLLDAAGFDVVLVETVGVGQDEVEIARLADVTLVVLVPGMGDDVQAIKAGIMEIADVFVINKADLPGADKLERELNELPRLVASSGWLDADDCATVASDGKGIAEALAAAREYHARGSSAARGAEIWSLRLREMLRERLLDRFPAEEFRGRRPRSGGAAARSVFDYCMTGSNATC